ncbi:AraC-type DNA-binding protein [Paenibacillus sp. 1_12]|uniref:helix-turn-helix transcriptional regulator n=1 Tax=Paenibacillus sp. 1_12 TaxID=1566278 RepID=UPI0008E579B8|nr:AraC family transcriptional regulator [Paenibacillus sp. 1_12]SFM38757.1 AraC-type DNA-binding protein [Paenibacillus sp. 1_12]
MKKHSRVNEEEIVIDPNRPTAEYIEAAHIQREKFLHAIQVCDRDVVKEFENELFQKFRDKHLNILNRVPNDKIRSYKNILLSHNTLYSYSAEKGGLSAWQTHFISEKYAIMIEHSAMIAELDQIHSNMVKEYSDPTIRRSNSDKMTIAEKVEKYIEMNFAEEISMDGMAAKLHVHPSHLMRAFKKEKGITISFYRNQRRLKEAKQLILYSNLSITEISIIVGFNTPQYFSTFFKEVEGVTPVEYKKSWKKTK